MRAALLILVPALLLLASCQSARKQEPAPAPDAAPGGMIPLDRLAARLALDVKKEAATHIVLTRGTNTVVLVPGRHGQVMVNGRPVGDQGTVESRSGAIYVDEALVAPIGARLRKGTPPPPPPGVVRPNPNPKPGPAPAPAVPRDLVGRTIVLDPGHGGRDPGAPGSAGMSEKQVNLDIARRAARLLAARGADVRLTRAGDTYVTLERRADIANDVSAQLFLSLHADAAENRAAHGFTVYVARSGSAASLLAAQALERALNGAGISSRGVRRADYRVLVRSRGPAVLVEVGFMSNRAESARLADPKHRERIARALATGVARGLAD